MGKAAFKPYQIVYMLFYKMLWFLGAYFFFTACLTETIVISVFEEKIIYMFIDVAKLAYAHLCNLQLNSNYMY